MVRVSVERDQVIFEVTGAHKLLALRSRIAVPRRSIAGVRRAGPGAQPRGWRASGVHIPGVITAGTYRVDGERVFWDVTRGRNAVVVDLRDAPYRQLVVEVDNPTSVVNLLAGAVPPGAG